MMLGVGKFGTSLHAFIIEKSLMHKLRPACLYSKIVLSKSDFRLARIAILRHEIASIARQHHVIYLAFSTGAKSNHFADISKMV